MTSARDVIAKAIRETTHVSLSLSLSDAILAALEAAGFYVIHRDELMKFLKAMEAAKETT